MRIVDVPKSGLPPIEEWRAAFQKRSDMQHSLVLGFDLSGKLMPIIPGSNGIRLVDFFCDMLNDSRNANVALWIDLHDWGGQA